MPNFPGIASLATRNPSGAEAEATPEVEPPLAGEMPPSPYAAESQGGDEDTDRGGSWAIFVNPSTNVVLRLPVHDEAEAAEGWRGPGAWTSDDDTLDDEALHIIAGIGRWPPAPTRRHWRREDTEVPCLASPALPDAPHAQPSSAAAAGPAGLHPLDPTLTTSASPHDLALLTPLDQDLSPPSDSPRPTHSGASPAGQPRPTVARRASPAAVESKSSEDGFPGWVTFRNPDTGVVLRLPAHDEAGDRWRGPGAWTSKDDALDDQAREIIAGIGRQPVLKPRLRWRREDSEVPCFRSLAQPDAVAGPAVSQQMDIFGPLTQTTQTPPAHPHPWALDPWGTVCCPDDLLPAFPPAPVTALRPTARRDHGVGSLAGVPRRRMVRPARTRRLLGVALVVLVVASLVYVCASGSGVLW